MIWLSFAAVRDRSVWQRMPWLAKWWDRITAVKPIPDLPATDVSIDEADKWARLLTTESRIEAYEKEVNAGLRISMHRRPR